MSGFEVDRSRFRKVHGNLDLEAVEHSGDRIEAIFKLREDGYVPPGVTIRARIDATMLTGEVAASLLPQLEQDPKVGSVAISRRLRIGD